MDQTKLYKLSSTQIKEQVNTLVKNGYYDDFAAENTQNDNNVTPIINMPSFLNLPSQINKSDFDMYDSTTDSEYTRSCCAYNYPPPNYTCDSSESTKFPSSIVTNTMSTQSYTYDKSSSTTQDTFSSVLSQEESLDNIFVCILDYKGKIEGDLSIKYSDKVRVISKNGASQDNNFVLAQSLKNRKYGYVPKKCLISLAQFLSNNVFD